MKYLNKIKCLFGFHKEYFETKTIDRIVTKCKHCDYFLIRAKYIIL